MTPAEKKYAQQSYWFKCRRKIKHRRWVSAAWHCVSLWATSGERHLGLPSVYSCNRGLNWYTEDQVRHYHVGRKGRMKREKELANAGDSRTDG